MSTLHERVIHTAIARGLVGMRSDPKVAYKLFRELKREYQDAIVAYFTKSLFNIRVGYSRAELPSPGICIILRGEVQTGPLLADHMGLDGEPDNNFDGAIEGQVLGGFTSASNTAGQPPIVWPENNGAERVASAGADYIDVAGTPFYPGQFAVGSDSREADQVHIEGGLGRGQVRALSSYTTQRLVVTEPWLTIPDSTSVFSIRKYARDPVVGNNTALFDQRSSTLFERRGAIHRVSVQIQCFDNDEWNTIYLATVVRAALFSQRFTTLEPEGIKNAKFGLSDMSYRPEYMPTTVFARSINMEFDHEFSVVEDFAQLLGDLNIEFYAPNVSGPVVTSTTQIGITGAEVTP